MVNPLQNYYIDEEEILQEDKDYKSPLEVYYQDELKAYKTKYDAEDKTSEDLKKMSVSEKRQYAQDLETEREYRTSKGVTKGIASGVSLGASEYIPGMAIEEGDYGSNFGKLLGSILPIEAAAQVTARPLIALASKSPVLTKQLQSLAGIIGIGATGATIKGAEDLIQGKLPSADDMLEHGAEWSLIDSALRAGGVLGRATAAVIKKAKATNKPTWQVVNDGIVQMRKEGVDFTKPDRVQAKALSIFEKEPAKATKEIKLNKPKEVSPAQEAFTRADIDRRANELRRGTDLRTKEVPEAFDRLGTDTEALAEPYVPKEFTALDIATENADNAVRDSIDSIGQRASTKKQLGSNVKKDIQEGIQAAEDSYGPAYDLAEEAAETMTSTPLNTVQTAFRKLNQLEAYGIKTKPEGWKKTMDTIENVMEDVGFKVQRDADGTIDLVLSGQEIPTRKLMSLGRRLNEIIKFDAIDKSVQDNLKEIVRAVKQDVRKSLGKNNKDALEMYEAAERQFGEAANKFGRDSIRKIRQLEKTENIANLIKSPTALADLKQTVSPQQYSQIERELMEHMNELSYDRAANFYREVRPELNPETQIVAQDILDSKLPKEAPSRRQKLYNEIENALFNDLSKSTITGERPKVALNLWKTKEGQQIIKRALEDNPNKSEVIKYLTDQSFNDFVTSFVSPQGKIDFKKFNSLLKDPATVENLRLIGGEEAVNFFKNIEGMSNRIKKNADLIEGKIDKLSSGERKRVEDYLREKGKERLKEIKGKSKQSSREEKIAEDILGENAIKEGKKSEESRKIFGENRLNKMKRKDYKMLFLADDFFQNLGVTTKLALALVGVSHFGLGPAAGALATYQVSKLFRKMATNRKVRTSLQRAAVPQSSPRAAFGVFEQLHDALEDTKSAE